MGNRFLPATTLVTFLAVAVGDTAALQDVRHEAVPTVRVAPVEVVTAGHVYTTRALDLVPYWCYVRNALLPQIRKALDRLVGFIGSALLSPYHVVLQTDDAGFFVNASVHQAQSGAPGR